MQTSPIQFDFEKEWEKKDVPLLSDPFVRRALNYGMAMSGEKLTPDKGPWEYGKLRGSVPSNDKCLEWYQPWGLCHSIATFCWAIGKRLYPELKWGFISSHAHSIAVGYSDSEDEPEVIMDILMFDKLTAEGSIAWAKSMEWTFFDSFPRYMTSFCLTADVYHQFVEMLKDSGMEELNS